MASRKHKKSAIPVGSQFSPDVVDFRNFLQAIVSNTGDRTKIATAVWSPTVRIKSKTSITARTRNLPIEAAIQYGLLAKRTFEATDLAIELAKLADPHLSEAFARHILLRLGGVRVLQGIREMNADGIPVTGDSLAHYLTSHGFNVTEHNTAINSMRMWLARAGVFPLDARRRDAWVIDEDAAEKLLGMSTSEVSALAGLEPHQLAFVDALCAIGPRKEYLASEVRDLASVRHPEVRFDRGSLPKDVLEPLRAAGLIEFKSGGTRRGKSSRLQLTDRFNTEVLQTFVTRTVKDLDPATTAYFNTRPEDIYADLASSSPGVRGRALEALAVRVMRLLGLRFLAWRRRAKDTGYAEVDALLAGVLGMLPTRWQVQCKNTPATRIGLDEVAKEVGVAIMTGVTHLLLIANARFSSEAVKFADEVMSKSPITVFLVGGAEFTEMRDEDASLGRILRAHAQKIALRLEERAKRSASI